MLSIGDGLVSQVPALITSVAAGILVTRATSKNDLGRELSRQLLFYPKALTILAVMLGFMAIVPGLPTMPFLTMAVAHRAAVVFDSQERNAGICDDERRERAGGHERKTGGRQSADCRRGHRRRGEGQRKN